MGGSGVGTKKDTGRDNSWIRRCTWGGAGWGEAETPGGHGGNKEGHLGGTGWGHKGTLGSIWDTGDGEGHGRDTQRNIKTCRRALSRDAGGQGGTFGEDTRSDRGRYIRGQGATLKGATKEKKGEHWAQHRLNTAQHPCPLLCPLCSLPGTLGTSAQPSLVCGGGHK